MGLEDPNKEPRPPKPRLLPFRSAAGRGVVPDHHVRPTIGDVFQGRDPEMEFAFELFRGFS